MHPDTLAGFIIFGQFLIMCACIAPFIRGK